MKLLLKKCVALKFKQLPLLSTLLFKLFKTVLKKLNPFGPKNLQLKLLQKMK